MEDFNRMCADMESGLAKTARDAAEGVADAAANAAEALSMAAQAAAAAAAAQTAANAADSPSRASALGGFPFSGKRYRDTVFRWSWCMGSAVPKNWYRHNFNRRQSDRLAGVSGKSSFCLSHGHTNFGTRGYSSGARCEIGHKGRTTSGSTTSKGVISTAPYTITFTNNASGDVFMADVASPSAGDWKASTATVALRPVAAPVSAMVMVTSPVMLLMV